MYCLAGSWDAPPHATRELITSLRARDITRNCPAGASLTSWRNVRWGVSGTHTCFGVCRGSKGD